MTSPNESVAEQLAREIKDTDEVWLALEQSYGAMARDGHHPSQDRLSCWCCYAMYLIDNAKKAYIKRHFEKVTSE